MTLFLVALCACTAPDADPDTSVEVDPLASGFLGRLEVAYTVRYDTAFAIKLANAERTVTTLIAVYHDDVVELAGVFAVGDGARVLTFVGSDLRTSRCYDAYWDEDVEEELQASAGTVTVDFDADGGTYTIDGATFERGGGSPIVESATGIVDAWQEPCESY